METDEPDRPAEKRTALVGAGVIGGLSLGWFALSHWMMGTSAADAVGEALGVALALLVVASVVGAVWSSRGRTG